MHLSETDESGIYSVDFKHIGQTRLNFIEFLFNEKDSRDLAVNINRLFTEPELYSKLVENMKDTVQKYSYTQVGKAYAEIIRSSMASRTDR